MGWLRPNPISAPDAGALAAQIRNLRDSRRVIVDAYEIERHRIERELHDGAQQQLVAVAMKVGEAAMISQLPMNEADVVRLRELLAEAQDAVDAAMQALRQTVSGVQLQLIQDHGLVAAINDLVERAPINVRLVAPYPVPALPLGVATAAYFSVSEALTNVAKYCPQANVSVLVTAGAELQISVVDDGPGGAQIVPGRGLASLRERLRAFGGDLRLSSPAGGPTTVTISVPMLLKPENEG